MNAAIAAVSKCKYCLFFHTEMAKLMGATDAEIEDALHYATSSMGWSTYISGMGTDFEQFKKEVLQCCSHVRAKMGAGASGTPARRGNGRAGRWSGREEKRSGRSPARLGVR